MNLGIEFAIYSMIMLSALIPIYFFREKIFRFLYRSSDFETFLTEIKKHLNINHPYIRFNYSIVETTADERNPKTRQILVVENLILQFAEYNVDFDTQDGVTKDLLWQTYEVESLPNKDKLPKDWLRRKDTAWKRDKSKCTRCGLKIDMNDSAIYLLKDINNGGTYHLENMITICNDCNRILNSDDVGKVIKSLNITEALMHKVIR